MVTSHRTLEGGWAVCPAPEACELLFHFPGMTPVELTVAPFEMLLPLFELMDPPTYVDERDEKHWGYWQIESDTESTFFAHRDYDLPAYVSPYLVGWHQHGLRHRTGDRPAIVRGAEREWYWEGERHREGDLPAWTSGEGSMSWFTHGGLHRDSGPAAIYCPNDHDGHAWSYSYYRNGEFISTHESVLLPEDVRLGMPS